MFTATSRHNRLGFMVRRGWLATTLSAAGMLSASMLMLACSHQRDPNSGATPANNPTPPPIDASAQSGDPSQPGQPPPSEVVAAAPVPPPTGTKGDGEKCLSAQECLSGICEGQGCDDAHPGTCQAKQRPCTYDLRPYCGCDGHTFEAGGNCPSRRFSAREACPTK